MKIKDIYGNIDLFSKSNNLFDFAESSETVMKSISTEDHQLTDYGIQTNLRKKFGKAGHVNNKIGGHPDFDNLNKGALKSGHVVSLFMDIKGSTRLGVLYRPQEVFFMKNAIIKCAIETIHALDGHVHRIMGDAVLAFFRADTKSPHDSAIDAINCGTCLVQFMKELVLPHLKDNALDADIGIRVGVDYGPQDEVIWGMYGYPGSSEITATSFFVDVAAKLQQNAPRNRVMIGESLRSLLDLHEGIVEKKIIISNGEKKIDPYISPNYTDVNGISLNYQQWVISHDKYYALIFDDAANFNMTARIKSKQGEPSSDIYKPCTRAIKYLKGIEFKVEFTGEQFATDYQVKFRVENHGLDAAKQVNNGNHENYENAPSQGSGHFHAKHWEGTTYNGLHYMFISLYKGGKPICPEVKYGIFVGR